MNDNMSESSLHVRPAVLSYPPRMSPPSRTTPDAEGAQSPPAAHRDDSLATNPPPPLVPEDHPPKRRRGDWGRAGVIACLAWLAWPTAAFAQTADMSVNPITGDGVVTALEKWNGFEITGNTGTSEGAVVTVTVNGTQVGQPTTSAKVGNAILATWSVNVLADQGYIYSTAGNQPVVASSPHLTQSNITISHTRNFTTDLTLPLSVNDITDDNNTINAQEKTDGFIIGGNTVGGLSSDPVAFSGVTVEVTIGTGTLTGTSNANGVWGVTVPSDAGYINETSVELSVTASKTGYTDATVTRTLPVDLTAPTVSYNTVQSRLFKGVAIGQLSPDLNNSSNDIASYAASNLPQGLAINQTKGFITGNPQSLNNNTQTATVTVTDTSGNTGTTMIVFPAVVEPSTVMISPQVLTVPEDSSAEYTVVLDIEPTHDVTVTVERGAGSDADLNLMENLDSLTLTFTDQDWDRPQTVTIFAAEDDDGENGIARFLHDVDSDDLSYNGIPVPPVRATEGENDTIGVTVLPTTVTVPEGGSVEYTLVLNTLPEGEVKIDVLWNSGGDADLTASTDELTFTSLNWQTAQPVTISAAEDDDRSDGTATFEHSVTSLYDEYYNDDDIVEDFQVIATEYDNDKDAQTLSGFTYSPSQIIFGDDSPTLTAPTVTVPATGGGTVTYSAAPDTVCTVDSSDGALTIIAVGTCRITATAAATDEGNYNATSVTVDVTVDKADQTLSGFTYNGSDSATVTYGNDPLELTALSGAVGAVTYSSSDTDVCTFDSSTSKLTIAGAGTCTITATAAATDDGNYNAASVTFELTVNTAAQTLSGFTYNGSDSATVTYGNDPLELTALSGAVGAVTYSSSDTDVCTFDSSTSKLTIAGAGTCTITATSARTANYKEASVTFELTVDKKGDQTLEDFAYSPSQITFGDDAPTLTAPTVTVPATGGGTVTYSAAPDTVCTVDSSDGALTIIAVGTCTITATAAATDDGNYNATSVTFELTVNTAAQTLSGFTYNGSDSATVTYGNDPLELTALSGAVGAVTYSSSDTDVCTFDSSTSKLTIAGAGTCTITATAAATDDGNYNATSVTVDVTVNTAAQTLSGFTYNGSDSATVTYGDDPLKLTALSSAVGAVTYSSSDTDVCTFDSSTSKLTIAGAGDCTITATAAQTANYKTESVTFDVEVAKADQTLEGFAYNASQVNFGTTPTLTAPSGAKTTVTYAASPATVCSVDSSSGALTITGGGTCTITATAAQTANYNAGTATFSVEMLVAGLTLRVDKIAGDNIINEEEKRDGFTISGDTGTESSVTVSVTIGGNELTSATSDANGNWSVSVPEDASSITEPSVWVLVTATHPNMSPTLTVSRELVVDLRDLTNLQVPMKVTDFRVAVADADTVVEDSYVLSWEDPGDNTIIKYEYRWYPRASWSEWTDIPESDTTSYTVAAAEAGLDLNTPYRFQIRAVNAKGAGPPSEYAANALLLPVHFGAAAYETEEGGAATTVTVTLSWPATKKLTIPIRVTPQGETVAADYMVAVTGQDDVWDAETGTVRLTFEVEGKRTRSFTIKAGDETGEKDFDDGTVLLSFGALPVGVIAGAPATATLTIIDDEGAVVRARFRRLNNEILSKHALTLADVTIAAVTSRQETGPRCAGQANTASLGGQSSLAEILTANAQTLTTGSLNLKQLLGTSSFRLRLTEDGSGAGPGCLTLWGQGDYRNLFSGDSQALDWDGDLITGQVGADVLLQPDLRAGLAVSWSEGDFGYTDRTDGEPFSGAYTSRIESVHPYVTWWSPMGLDVWATGGYGRGKIEIEDEEVGTHSSDTTLRLASVGASGPLLSEASLGGTTTVRLKAQASLAQMEVEGNGSLLEEQTIAAQRLRLAMEGSHERTLASGGSLTPSFEVGLRHDVGAGATGTGLELGGGLRYVDPALGLTVEVRGRVLAAYEEAYEEWGASGLIRVDPGSDGQGLSLSLAPSYGQTASGMQRLWDQGLPQGPTQGPTQGPSATQAPTGWLEAEVGYGLAAFAGQGLVTPYGQFSLGGGMQQYRVGSRLELGSGLRLSLEGTRQVTTVGQADQGIRLQADWQF